MQSNIKENTEFQKEKSNMNSSYNIKETLWQKKYDKLLSKHMMVT